ncbi:tudor domain-containing protein 10-like [Lissotriton helveticus]
MCIARFVDYMVVKLRPGRSFQVVWDLPGLGNLSSDVNEEQIVDLFKDFNPLHVKKCQSGMKCFAFVDFSSAKTQQNVISKCHGTKFSGRSVTVKALIKLNGSKSPDYTSRPVNMPILEKVPLLDCNGCSDGLGKLLPKTLKATKACYAVSLEMRCWEMEVIEELAVVFFVDFGRSATVLASSLRALENKTFWAIPPLTQPFMLQDGVFHTENIVGSILKGKINGLSPSESHILMLKI